MLYLSHTYGFVVQLTIDAKIDVNSHVKISAANKAGKASSGDFCVGILISLPAEYPGNASVLTKYSQKRQLIASAEVNPGDRLKLGTDGSGGEQRYMPFVPGTDEPGLEVGIALTAASGADENFDALIA